jgi:glutathione synthase/RimK-type ligase-like ATP-grasp enzyme
MPFQKDKVYNYEIKENERKIKKNINFKHLILIGFDIIIDSYDNKPYLLEGNATPGGLPYYESLYDLSLSNAIKNYIKDKGKIGINLDANLIKNLKPYRNRYKNLKYIMNILNNEKINYITFSDNEILKSNGKWQARNEEFDFFWNRCFGIPKSYNRLLLNRNTKSLIPDVPCIKLMFDKWETYELSKEEMPVPFTIKVGSKKEEIMAIEKISSCMINKYGSKTTAKVIIKPINGTGGNGIQFIDNPIEMHNHQYPSLVQERIIPELYNGKIVDLRIFFVNGWVSRPIARISPEKFNKKEIPLEKRLLTSISSGGEPIKTSDYVYWNVIDYIMNTSIKLEESLQRKIIS